MRPALPFGLLLALSTVAAAQPAPESPTPTTPTPPAPTPAPAPAPTPPAPPAPQAPAASALQAPTAPAAHATTAKTPTAHAPVKTAPKPTVVAPAPVSVVVNAPAQSEPSEPKHDITDKVFLVVALPRESAIETALGRGTAMAGVALGGYGEVTLDAPSNGEAVLDFRRFVLYVGHDFTDKIRFYSEIEVEHAVASSTDRGETEIEQGYLDGLLGRHFNVRGGLLLMPMGIVNVYHEPPSFNGVDRPDVDRLVIPSTWREPGAGIFGELAGSVRYQLYLVNGFNANGFNADRALRGGSQEAQLAHAGDYGAIARVDYEPVAGTVFGASAYTASSGNSLTSTVGHVPVGLFDIDVRYHHKYFSARGEIAMLLIGDTEALNTALRAGSAEQQAALPVSSRSQGAYAEVAYDVLHLLAPSSDQGLDVFARFDYVDTQAAVLGRWEPRPEFRRKSQMVGLVYRPVPQIGIKFDYRRIWLGSGESFNEFASAITWLF